MIEWLLAGILIWQMLATTFILTMLAQLRDELRRMNAKEPK